MRDRRIRITIVSMALCWLMVLNPVFSQEPLEIDEAPGLLPMGIDLVEEESVPSLAMYVYAPLMRMLNGRTSIVDGSAEILEAVVDAVLERIDEVAPTIEESLTQLRATMYLELHFVRFACTNLTIEQRKAIREAVENRVNLSVRQQVAGHLFFNAIELVGMSVDELPQPLTEIRDEIDSALKNVLTEEQYRNFAEATAARISQRKRVAILAIISRLDGNLLLTKEQRTALSDAFSTHWRPSWESSLLFLEGTDDNCVPELPDAIVMPCLNETQQAVWSLIQKFDLEQNFDEVDFQTEDAWWKGESDEPSVPDDTSE
jgi:hypothetical protein